MRSMGSSEVSNKTRERIMDHLVPHLQQDTKVNASARL